MALNTRCNTPVDPQLLQDRMGADLRGWATAACCVAARLRVAGGGLAAVVGSLAGRGGGLAGEGGGGWEEKRRAAQGEKGKGEGIKGLTLNLLSFSLSVSLIYIRGFTITNGPGPIT